jgi:galactokinase
MLKEKITSVAAKTAFEKIYRNPEAAVSRFADLAEEFVGIFGESDADLFTAPGRTEILGNHTDHNRGKVLTASVDMDTIGVAKANNTDIVRLISKQYGQDLTIDLSQLPQYKAPFGTAALLAGICEGARSFGYQVRGFDACISSEVISAAGVSSSASFEMLICAIVNQLFNQGSATFKEYARIGQYAENNYWNKKSGLLDQMACAIGGTVYIDFATDIVEKIDFSFGDYGYKLIIVNTGKSHSDLSAEYSTIPIEMKSVAQHFGKSDLSEISVYDVIRELNAIRAKTGDRAIMRAFHYYEENRRVDQAIEAIKAKDDKTLFKLIQESGDSSWKWLQNCYAISTYNEQSVPVSQAVTQLFINKVKGGVVRVHGGGFAGVIMSLVPMEFVDYYIEYMEPIVGKSNIYPLEIRAVGTAHII